MPRKRYSAEQIILTCKTLEISEQTYYRWRREYGGMDTTKVKKLKELEKENTRLKRLVADLSLDNAILKEVLSKK
jgi:putative transposase